MEVYDVFRREAEAKSFESARTISHNRIPIEGFRLADYLSQQHMNGRHLVMPEEEVVPSGYLSARIPINSRSFLGETGKYFFTNSA